jgi:hypothetical protein
MVVLVLPAGEDLVGYGGLIYFDFISSPFPKESE